MSPACSFGTNEYGWPHLVQKPSVRPGRSPRARPTGAPQSEREQNRLRSGTSAVSRTIERGSGRGTSGTCTRPTPSRARPEELAVFPEADKVAVWALRSVGNPFGRAPDWTARFDVPLGGGLDEMDLADFASTQLDRFVAELERSIQSSRR